MEPKIGESAREYIAERRRRSPAFDEALTEARVEADLAREVAWLRERRGLSQYQLAELTGIKQPMINRLERGDQNPTLATLRKLAVALHAVIEVGGENAALRPVEEPERVRPAPSEHDARPGRGRLRAVEG